MPPFTLGSVVLTNLGQVKNAPHLYVVCLSMLANRSYLIKKVGPLEAIPILYPSSVLGGTGMYVFNELHEGFANVFNGKFKY